MVFHQGGGRTAVIFPGRFYTPDRPLLYYARGILASNGWSVEEVWWNEADIANDETVKEKVEKVLDGVEGGASLVMGKSLGSLAMPSVTKRGIPAIWLTPLFNRPDLVSASKSLTAKTLLVGGTADSFWDGDIARASGQQVLELPGADHDLGIAGDVLASLALLNEIVTAMAKFVESL